MFKTMDSMSWSNSHYIHKTKKFGDSYRLILRIDPNTDYLQIYEDVLLDYFGIGDEEKNIWSICETDDHMIKAISIFGCVRLEDGSYLEKKLEIPKFGMSPYGNNKTHINHFEYGVNYKYTCDTCSSNFNTFWCRDCNKNTETLNKCKVII